MRISLTAAVVTAGFCLLVAGIASADVTNTRWQLSLIRGSSTLETVYAPSEAEVWTKCTTRIAEISEAGNPSTVYACQTLRYYATAVSTCQPAQPQQTKQVTCPAGTTGTWTQTGTSTVSPAPGCNVTTTWSPPSAPADACVAPPSNAVTLRWAPPTQNTDGTALTNLAGYRISYGTSPTALVQTIQVASAGASTYTISNLAPGAYYFAVRAYTADGTESRPSNVLSKTVL